MMELNPTESEKRVARSALGWHVARDFAILAVFFTVPFFAALQGGSLEHQVCARVLAIEDGKARVDYWWGGRLYTKTFASDNSFKPAGKATVSLHFVGAPENAVRGYGGHAPYTILGNILVILPFFLAGGFVMAVWRFIGKQRVATAAVEALDFLIRRFGKKPTPKMRLILCAAIAFIIMGTLNSLLQARQPRSNPHRLANAFLTAVSDRDLNKAAYLVAYENRYAFVTDSPSWVLLEYDVLDVREDTIRYRHSSEIEGRRLALESILPVVRSGGQYWIGPDSVPR